MSDQAKSSIVDEKTGLMRLFTGDPQHENFCRIKDLFRVAEMAPSSRPQPLPRGSDLPLPETFTFEGQQRNLAELIEVTDTAALLVVKDGVIRHELYRLTGGPTVPWLSASVAKSFTSALVGIALGKGLIDSLQDPVDKYVDLPKDAAYAGISIEDILQMSSGVRWYEDYSVPDTDVFHLIEAMGADSSYDQFVRTRVRAGPPGVRSVYNSGDTLMLGILVSAVTGKPLHQFMQEELCEPLGMESPGWWIVDRNGCAGAFGFLNLTARDYAKFGELYRNGGNWHGSQIVPADYAKASVTPGKPHLVPGQPEVGGHPIGPGYGYQWWLPEGGRGDFSAIGVYNQFVYVDPANAITIVKLSANRAYGTTADEAENRNIENLEALRSISEQLGKTDA